jgi:hypothetical protein
MEPQQNSFILYDVVGALVVSLLNCNLAA